MYPDGAEVSQSLKKGLREGNVLNPPELQNGCGAGQCSFTEDQMSFAPANSCITIAYPAPEGRKERQQNEGGCTIPRGGIMNNIVNG